jgi:hypothetical protein
MGRAIASAASVLVWTFAGAINAAAQHWRVPDGYDNQTPRYYDYRAPRAYYPDEAPAALRLQPPLVVIPPPAVAPVPPAPPAPLYAPTGTNLAPSVYPPPPYGYVVPYPPISARPICGVYRFWSGERCIDARGD